MKAITPGQGRWRRKGRGRRLACGLQMDPDVEFVRASVILRHTKKQCRYCGQIIQWAAEVGRIESIRILEA